MTSPFLRESIQPAYRFVKIRYNIVLTISVDCRHKGCRIILVSGEANDCVSQSPNLIPFSGAYFSQTFVVLPLRPLKLGHFRIELAIRC
jgi:hypothetical protein